MTVLSLAANGVDSDEPPSGTPRREWALALAIAGCAPLLVGYALVGGLLALVTSVAARASASVRGVLASAGPGWLAANHVPLEIRGAPLGVLPLLPTALVSLLAGSAGRAVAGRLGLGRPAQIWPVVVTVAGAHAVFGTVLALASSHGPVTASPALSFFGCGLLAAVSSLAGLGRRCGLAGMVRDRFGSRVVRGLWAGALGAMLLLAAGTAVTVLGLIVAFSRIGSVFAQETPDAGSGVGLLLLSVGYLPNALVCALSFLAGPGFSVGPFSTSPFGTSDAALPRFPLLTALPGPAPSWWPAVLLVPAVVGVFVGLACRRTEKDRAAQLRVVTTAAGVVAVCALLLGMLAGGEFGGGALRTVSIPAGLLAAACFCWIAVPGALVVYFGGSRDTVIIADAAAAAAAVSGTPADGPSDEAAAGEDRSEDQGASAPNEGSAGSDVSSP